RSEIGVASLLHPCVYTLVVEPPAADSSGGAEYRNGPRTIEVAGAGEVHDSAVVVSQRVLRGTIGHEHDVVLVAEDALVEVNRDRAGPQAIGSGGGKSRLNRKLDVVGQRISGHGYGSWRNGHAHSPVLHRDRPGSGESENVALALSDGLVSVIADDRQCGVVGRVHMALL